MGIDDVAVPQERGPLSYENWRASLSGIPWRAAIEYPLFSDAHIVGGLTDEYGPYRLTNAIALNEMRRRRPAIVLGVTIHSPNELPDMRRTDDARYHGGFLYDEIAALVSLCLGIRLKAGDANRRFDPDGDLRGIPISGAYHQDPILPELPKKAVLPGALETHALSDAAILAGFPMLSEQDANALVRAARLYQEAVWIAETTPELSWLMLASAVETAANKWREATAPPVERLRTSKPDLAELLATRGDEEFVAQVAEILVPYMGATKKFIDFIVAFLPDPPPVRPPKAFQHPWSRGKIKDAMSQIYNYRSLALHDGRPFPGPMCMAPGNIADPGVLEEIPLGFATSIRGGTWLKKDTPMLLHTFEYIARHALLKWWRSMTPASITPTETSSTAPLRVPPPDL